MSPTALLDLPETRRWMQERIDEGTLFSGAQVAVVHRGAVAIDLAIGTEGRGRPVDPGTQFRVYCAAKPLLATVVCRAAETGALDRRAPLSRFHPRLEPPVGDLAIDDLLDHQAPLHRPTGFGSVFIPNGTRAQAVLRTSEAAIRQGTSPAYGEVAGWLLLAQALAWTTGHPWGSLAADHCLRSGLPRDEVSLDAADLLRNDRRGRVGLNVSLRGGRRLPLLGELDPSLSSRLDGPGFGPACTMRFLARLVHDSVVVRGDGSPSRARTVADDPTFGRDVAFSDGLMVGPESLGISDLWPADVAGHIGIAGMTLVFASRALDLAVAVHLNGMMGPQDGGDHVRPFLTSLLHGELAAALGGR